MKKISLALMFLISTALMQAADITIVDSGTGTGTTTWTKDNVYILDGFVFVNDGQTLTIEPGTVIKGKSGSGADASALVVARGGIIIAEGTAAEPIIFTGESDDVANPFDVPLNTTGLWGGLIVLGKASLNSAPGETAVEGIPTTEVRGLYGGTDDTDSSGVIKYVSIRHGGTDIGAGNEINGLTLGGVGSRTVVDYVEVIFNADDGVEFFGGTVNTSHIITAYCGDDSYDYDEGFRGKGQFWAVFQSDDAGSDRGGEHDGGTTPETASPYATPVIYNVTSIGRGAAAGKRALTFRDNAGGEYHNSIFIDHAQGVDVEFLASGTHSYDRLDAGELKLANNIFWNVAGNVAADIFSISADSTAQADKAAEVAAAETAIDAYFASANNAGVDPLLSSISRTNDKKLDPRPSSSGPAYQDLGAYPAGDDFFTPVDYKGAFSNSTDMWALGWTYMDELGYFGTNGGELTSVREEIEARLASITLFPNPTNGSFTVNMNDLSVEPVQLVIFDMVGNVVYNQTQKPVAGELETQLDLPTLPAGIYLLKSQQANQVIGIKRIIKK